MTLDDFRFMRRWRATPRGVQHMKDLVDFVKKTLSDSSKAGPMTDEQASERAHALIGEVTAETAGHASTEAGQAEAATGQSIEAEAADSAGESVDAETTQAEAAEPASEAGAPVQAGA
jgi:hypothetical protein